MKKQSAFIVVSVTVLACIMNIVDLFIKPLYFVKSIVKVLLFLPVPLIYFLLNKKERKIFENLFRPRKKDLFPSVLLGLLAYASIVGGYFLLRDYIDFSNITKSLTSDIGVNADNFLYVSLYISLCNSFLEEFFFRGFAFAALQQYMKRLYASLFSAAIFAFYHIGMTFSWVAWPVFLGGFAGLFAGGLIFNFLNANRGNLYASWLLHMFINFAINTVGFILFRSI